MLEWQKVTAVDFKNASGNVTSVKVRHEFQEELSVRDVEVNERDMDLLAFEEMGTEMESLRIAELNATVLIENDYDMTKIKTMKVPN